MKANAQKNTLLKNAQANAASNFFKRVFFSPTQEEFYIFSSTLRCFIFFATAQCLTRQDSASIINRFVNRFVPTFDLTHLRTDRRASGNRVACPTMQNMAGRGAHTTVSRLYRDTAIH